LFHFGQFPIDLWNIFFQFVKTDGTTIKSGQQKNMKMSRPLDIWADQTEPGCQKIFSTTGGNYAVFWDTKKGVHGPPTLF